MRRVDEAMREVLSDVIAKDLKDPRVGFVTVTGVKTSPDLRHGRVYVSVLGSDTEREASMAGLRSAHGFLQRRVAAELSLKHTPSLTFEYDESIDRGMRISHLIDTTEAATPATTPAQDVPTESAPAESTPELKRGADER
jgi:ribosome-binding factor A